MHTEDYLEQVLKVLKTSPVVMSYEIEFDVKSSTLSLIYGEVLFRDGSTLEFLELIRETHGGLERLKYRFQYRKATLLVLDTTMLHTTKKSVHFPTMCTLAESSSFKREKPLRSAQGN